MENMRKRNQQNIFWSFKSILSVGCVYTEELVLFDVVFGGKNGYTHISTYINAPCRNQVGVWPSKVMSKDTQNTISRHCGFIQITTAIKNTYNQVAPLVSSFFFF